MGNIDIYEYSVINHFAVMTDLIFNGNVQINRYDAEGLRHEMEENSNVVTFIFTSTYRSLIPRGKLRGIRLLR